MTLDTIINSFEIEGSFVSSETIVSGYINTTYKATTANRSYILQKINHSIFKNVEELSKNIIRITEHIASKASKGKDDFTLKVIPSKNNEGFYKDSEGNYWRMFNYLENSTTFEVLESIEQANSLGKAFGNYQKLLIDLPAPNLFEILPDFHNTPLRIEHFNKSITVNFENRKENAGEEINYLLNLAPEMGDIVALGNQKKIPLRSIHQDAKLSNILFNTDNDDFCIIDLDTTMPGYLCYDFGDAVRTGMNTAGEEEKDISKASLNMNLFKPFAKGYAKASKQFITKEEIKTLVLGAKTITYEQAIRFLADYLNGDIYYQTSYPENNLIRTKVQIELLKDIIEKYDEMLDYVLKQYK
ncbi:Ser/Thr protein kinase RdoA involved in Cpx stress response, MazF antagonist [Tenacibaculum sp. MAR_2009_124]|uniref:phosphotransferase enzyme family protein n=1 Tax=Tenacibaculum sp. MAR_2009_124 TaxID=1250059 RepID=UPI00089A7313|nr:aminoglycoside phosphotransferase family protein [Tenacibaculum sp. MAR_2009_124]SEB81823.1 Ser/Thr protein kinase RdoA involved in Cpx stress response, MazF antagonist [Tenacibaculum sp. MAR_2009_124]